MTRGVRDEERGMILVNVLLFIAVAAGMVMLMINREQISLDQSLRMREAARALSVVRGGELSAVVALRRDARDGGAVDHRGETWAAIEDSGAPIAGGTFDLAIADAQGRFNINNVRSAQAADKIMFRAIGQAAGLTDEQILAVAGLVRQYGPITDLRPIRLAGLEPDVATRLETLVTALPDHSDINLNAATPAMLTLLFRDPAIVERLVALRDRQGFLTADDLSAMDQTVPAGTGFRSDHFWVRVRATLGDGSQQEAALIARRRGEDGVRVATIERWRGAAVPPDAPPFAPPAS